MAKQVYTFSQQSARRIVSAVRRVEALPLDLRGRPSPPRIAGGGGSPAGFWARVGSLRTVGEEATSQADGYDWVRMDAVDGELIESDPAITGSGTAWEVNDVGVNPGTIVWMRPAGQVQDGEEDSEPVMVPAYLFRASVGGGFWALLGGNTTIGDNRWSYSFQESTYQKLGEFMPGGQGRSGTAYNAIESGNQFAGTQGNGIETSALPGGVTMRPIGAGAVVWMREVINCETHDVEYVFEAVNAIGGACD